MFAHFDFDKLGERMRLKFIQSNRLGYFHKERVNFRKYFLKFNRSLNVYLIFKLIAESYLSTHHKS